MHRRPESPRAAQPSDHLALHALSTRETPLSSRGDERVQCRHHVALVLAQRALRLRLVELHLGGDQVDVRLGAREWQRERAHV